MLTTVVQQRKSEGPTGVMSLRKDLQKKEKPGCYSAGPNSSSSPPRWYWTCKILALIAAIQNSSNRVYMIYLLLTLLGSCHISAWIIWINRCGVGGCACARSIICCLHLHRVSMKTTRWIYSWELNYVIVSFSQVRLLKCDSKMLFETPLMHLVIENKFRESRVLMSAWWPWYCMFCHGEERLKKRLA